MGKRERGSDLVEKEKVDLGRKVGSAVDLNEESAGVLADDLKIGSADMTEVVLKKGGCEVLYCASLVVGVPLAIIFTVAAELLGSAT